MASWNGLQGRRRSSMGGWRQEKPWLDRAAGAVVAAAVLTVVILAANFVLATRGSGGASPGPSTTFSPPASVTSSAAVSGSSAVPSASVTRSAAATPSASPSPPLGRIFAPPAGSSMPADFVTDGAEPTEEWGSVAFHSAPAAMADWTARPAEYSGGWLAWSGNVAGDPGSPALVWLSPDGRTWRAAMAPGRVFGTATGLVAYGGGQAWTSPDGVTWTPHNTDAPDNHTCVNCTGSPIGVVNSSQVRGGIDFSADGIAFEHVDLPDSSDLTGPDKVIWSGSALVATKQHQTGPGAGEILVWASTDGRSWSGGVVSAAPTGSEIGQFVAARSGILLELLDANGKTIGWLKSKGGSSWQPADGVDGLLAMQGVRKPVAGQSPVVITSNGYMLLAIVYRQQGGWDMAISGPLDPDNWTDLQGEASSTDALVPEMMPCGVYLQFAPGCWTGADAAGCSTMPPGGSQYGQAYMPFD